MGHASPMIGLLLAALAPAEDPKDGAEAFVSERRAEVRRLEEGVRTLREELKVDLADIRRSRELVVELAEAEHRRAQLRRRNAGFAVREYEEGIARQERAKLDGELKMAEAELARARDEAEWAERNAQNGGLFIPKSKRMGIQLARERAEFERDQAQTRIRIFEEYDKELRLDVLRSDVAKAEADERAKKATLELERTRDEKVRRDAERFRLLSPQEHVTALLREAIDLQSRSVELLRKAAPAKAEPNAEHLRELQDRAAEISKLQEMARSRLDDALALSAHLADRWEALFAAEEALKAARDRLAIAEGLFVPKGEDGP